MTVPDVPAELEAATQRVKELSERVIDQAKQNGLTWLEGYEKVLESLLKTMHKGTRHVGKVPETLRQNRELSDRLRLLQKRLTKAIEAEDFEEAAILRDEIKQTTARLTSSAAMCCASSARVRSPLMATAETPSLRRVSSARSPGTGNTPLRSPAHSDTDVSSERRVESPAV